jgi:hypothetical protein
LFFFESIELELKGSYGGTIPEPPANVEKNDNKCNTI